MRVNSTQYQVKVWIYLFLCPLDLILWFLSSWVKLWATSLWTIKFGAGNLNISLPVYHHRFVCLVGYTLACQYCWTVWINLRWIGISRLVNGPISFSCFRKMELFFEMKIRNKVLPMKMLHSEWLMFLFRVRNTYSVIALCREEIDECEGGERELFLAGKREEKVRATSPPSQQHQTIFLFYLIDDRRWPLVLILHFF